MDSIVELKNVGVFFSKPSTNGKEIFWALDDINLSVKRGEVIGIIGPNGAGKTTLLSLIGGILKPDKGSLKVNGKTAPFLGLGVGFHPELTAEDNILLYGSILGLSPTYLKKQIPMIMEFAGLEGFEKLKVKHFSSGMYVRLGFAVSILVEPDIFLIDEVLSVGDASFMKKSIAKIKEFIEKGKTCFIVSHDLGLILKFARRVIWIDRGKIVMDGEGEQVIDEYIASINKKSSRVFKGENLVSARWGTQEVVIEKVIMYRDDGTMSLTFGADENINIDIYYSSNSEVRNPIFGLNIQTSDGTIIVSPNSRGVLHIERIKTRGVIKVKIPPLNLNTGIYYLTVAVYDSTNFHPYDHRERLLFFNIENDRSSFTDSLIIPDVTWFEDE